MTGCVLSAAGKSFDVDGFLQSSEWRGRASVLRQGEVTKLPKHPVRLFSGLQIDITAPDDNNIRSQIENAVNYIREHSAEIQRLRTFPGVEEIELRMGSFWYPDTVCASYSLPPVLLLLAGQHNIQITIGVYSTTED